METLRSAESYKTQVKYGASLDDIYTKICIELKDNAVIEKNCTILCFNEKQVDYFLDKNPKWKPFSIEQQDVLTVCPIAGYKGLENSFIFMLGPETFEPEDKNQMTLLYIGITRATTQCTVYFTHENEEIVN